MNCEEFEKELPGEVDGSNSSPRMEAHRQGCAACSELWEDLHYIRRQARLIQPREQPSERVWQEIRRQLQQEGLMEDPFRRKLPRLAAGFGWFPRLRMGLAYTAVFLVALGGVYVYSVPSTLQVPLPEAHNPMATTLGLTEESPSGRDEPIWQLIEKVPPEKRPTYVSNLHRVNSSIQQLNTFLATHPEDWFAREQLFNVYQQKERLWETLVNWEEF